MKRRWKHLEGAIRFEAEPGLGMCIHRAAAFVLDQPESELVFGTFKPARVPDGTINPLMSDEPYIHAWAELDGKVYAPTLLEKMGFTVQPINLAYYYEVNGAHDIHRLTRRQLLTLSGQIGLSAYLRKGVSTKVESVGGALLDAAGVKWTENEMGGLIPKVEKEVDA